MHSSGRHAAHTDTGRAARSLPAALIVLGAVIQLATPPEVTFTALFTAAPLIAAPLYSRRGTALTGLTATLVLMLLIVGQDDGGWARDISQAVTMTTVAAIALGINRVLRRGTEQLASARGVAEVAQLAVLPAPPERMDRLEIAARYQAAHADARIGGDLYAAQQTPFGARLILGDVRGKGLGAVEAVGVVIGAFREAAEQESELGGVADRLDRALVREEERRRDPGEPGPESFEGFATAVLAEITSGGVLRVVNRGHPPPVLLCADGEVRVLDPDEPALPLGLACLVPERLGRSRGPEVFDFPVGSTLLLHTDGLSEARDAAGAFYQLVPRIRAEAWHTHRPQALLEELVTDVAAHTGGRADDDMALLAVVRHR